MSVAAAWTARSEPRLARRILARVVDDGMLFAIAALIATVAETFAPHREGGVLQLMMTFDESEVTGPSTISAAITVAVICVATLGYLFAVSKLDGRSPGRALARVAVVRIDGHVPTTRHLFGRELLRVFMLAVAVALVWPLHHLVAAIAVNEASYAHIPWFLQAFAVWLPATVVAGLWISVALVDPLERAPHDRVAGTRVVAAPKRAP